MEKNGVKFMLLALLISSPLLLFLPNNKTENIIPEKIISITKADIYLPFQGPSWNLLDKIKEEDKDFENMELKILSGDKNYEEIRIRNNGGQIQVSNIIRTEKEREVGLKLLDINTGDTNTIKIITRVKPTGIEVESPLGYEFEIVRRPSGLTWNHWNTEYKVIYPADKVVVSNAFPRETYVNGRKVIENFVYIPYSSYFRQKQILTEGRNHIKSDVAQAFELLRQRGVQSRSNPGTLIADILSLKPEFFEKLPFIEQSELTDFLFDPEETADRVLVILTINDENAWAKTCNYVDACGWVQFTPRTYRDMRAIYPSALLMSDFGEGAGNHVNSIIAAVLLFDNNLTALKNRYGNNIEQDPNLEEYLDAMYNSSPGYIYASIDNARTKGLIEWTGKLLDETKGFIIKKRGLELHGYLR